MLIEGQDCSDVLIQLAAVKSEVNGAGKEHISQCIVEAIQENDQESIDHMNKAIDSFMK